MVNFWGLIGIESCFFKLAESAFILNNVVKRKVLMERVKDPRILK